jgi:hypothetical protein
LDFDVIADHILSNYQILVKKNEVVRRLFIEFKEVYASVRREALYSILTKFGTLMKLIKMCSIRTYSKVYIGKYFSVE